MNYQSPSRVRFSRSDRDHNAEGTFEFPPIARSYEQLVDFWLNVSVPDQVLHQLRAEYHDAQAQKRLDAINEEPEPQKFSYGQLTPEWDAWFTRANDLEVQMLAEHPGVISPVMARPLARATMLVRQAQTLEDAQPGITEQVRALQMDLSVLGNPTIGSLLDMYPTLDLPDQTWTDQRTEYLAVLADRIEDVVALLGGEAGDEPAPE